MRDNEPSINTFHKSRHTKSSIQGVILETEGSIWQRYKGLFFHMKNCKRGPMI